ncbi:MAG: 2'-deoxycytidine 5'-triphosphate deaminase [Candidatus Nanoarchaeia archaeon]|nr:2'-deoxycytidine 5'-triphosphate deaminase [Candidatus Nanoarchaeia archaeon]
MNYKVLVDKNIKELIQNKKIKSYINVDLNEYLQPASLDIPVSNIAYLVKFKFIPFKRKVEEIIESIKLDEINLDNNPILFKGQTYLIPCLKIEDLQSNINNKTNKNKKIIAKISPKSSIGRIDVMVRAITNKSCFYDYIKDLNDDILWLEVTPQSFNIRLKTGISLSQLMFLEESEDKVDIKKNQLLFDCEENLKDNFTNEDDEIVLNIEIPDKKIIGYVARKTNDVIDLSKTNYLDKNIFFEEIKNYGTNHNKIILEKDKFYILRTKDFIQIPPEFSGEMLPLNNIFGEFRVHYAGFFDPGFGYNMKGNQGVLEIRPHEDLMIYDNQPICTMKFYKNKDVPNKIYGQSNNNYSKQKDIKLSKYFMN